MNTRKCFASLGLFLIFLFLSVTAALADSHARIVRLSLAEGDVLVDRADGHSFDTAFLNMPVVHAGRVWTRRDGFAEIEFENGSTIRLTPETIVSMNDLSLDGSGNKISTIELEQGLAYFNLKKSSDNEFHVLFAHQELGLDQSAHFRINYGRDQIALAVFKGDVKLKNNSPLNLTVRKGESLIFDAEDKSRYFLARSIPVEGNDSWDQDRTEYHDKYALAQANEVYSPGYMYGASDLNYYGTYFPVSGYGYVWRPHSVGYNWDPFANGSWIFYPNYGYVWTSRYPWGWTPYRYGQWAFIAGYGWCWQPHHHWNNWAPLSGVLNPPRNFNRPLPPQNPGPAVIVNRPPIDSGFVPRAGGFERVRRFNGDEQGDLTHGRRTLIDRPTAMPSSPVPTPREAQPMRRVIDDDNLVMWRGRQERLQRALPIPAPAVIPNSTTPTASLGKTAVTPSPSPAPVRRSTEDFEAPVRMIHREFQPARAPQPMQYRMQPLGPTAPQPVFQPQAVQPRMQSSPQPSMRMEAPAEHREAAPGSKGAANPR